MIDKEDILEMMEEEGPAKVVTLVRHALISFMEDNLEPKTDDYNDAETAEHELAAIARDLRDIEPLDED